MIDESFAKNLENEMAKDFPEARQPLKVAPIRQDKPVSLTEQWSRLVEIDKELRDRVRRSRSEMMAAFDAAVVAIKTDFDRRVEEAVADLEAKRQQELRRLTNDTEAKLRDLDLLAARMG
jgi:hypothetical protein